jgi:hypothetical protein
MMEGNGEIIYEELYYFIHFCLPDKILLTCKMLAALSRVSSVALRELKESACAGKLGDFQTQIGTVISEAAG